MYNYGVSATYYRLHRDDAPALTADNAWSVQIGCAVEAHPDREVCLACDAADGVCAACEGRGWIDARRGYSVCDSAEALVAYVDRHGLPGQRVAIIRGREVGVGYDNESLVVPARVRWTTIDVVRAVVAARAGENP